MASWPRFLVLFRKRYLKRYFAIITLLGSLSCIFFYIRYTLSQTHRGTESNLQERFLRLPLMNRMEYMTLFPTCPYNPSFLVRRKLERYQGVWLSKESLVFPQDDTDMSSKEQVKKWASPNPVINKNRVECIVNEFTSVLRRK